MHAPVPPPKPSLWSFLSRRGHVIAAVILIAMACLFFFAPDIQGDRDWRGPAYITLFILAGLAIAAWAKRKDGAP